MCARDLCTGGDCNNTVHVEKAQSATPLSRDKNPCCATFVCNVGACRCTCIRLTLKTSLHVLHVKQASDQFGCKRANKDSTQKPGSQAAMYYIKPDLSSMQQQIYVQRSMIMGCSSTLWIDRRRLSRLPSAGPMF